MAISTVVIVTLMGCYLTAGHPDPSSAQQEESGSLTLPLEAREGQEGQQSPSPGVRQFSIAIPELKQTQFQAFDDKGTYSFGYAFPDQMHTESRTSDGKVNGAYFYKDPNGLTNQVQYRADDDGFRVSANNLPVFTPGEQPKPVQDTPEVEEAKRKHLELWDAIAQHNRAQQQSAEKAAEKSLVPVAVPVASDDMLPQASENTAKVLPVRQVSRPSGGDDVVIDEDKQAVITNQEPSGSSSVIEIDAEPIRLLAQLYSKHNQDNGKPQEAIQRPEGFHPQNLQPTAQLDLFSRSEGEERNSVVVTNPEFVDLRAFLLTNRFRAGAVPQIVVQAQERPNPNKDDLSTSDEADQASYPSEYSVPKELFNYYFSQPVGKPVVLSRETMERLPESLKLAIQKQVAPDGIHNAQVAPSRQQQQQQYSQQPFVQSIFSPYSSYYSPYYYYRAVASYPYSYPYAYPYYNNYHPYSGYPSYYRGFY